MSEYRTNVHWQRERVGASYSRNHMWSIADGLDVPASASPSLVPPPYSSPGCLDPETAFVGSIASCHMLWFLSLAEARGYEVATYRDGAVGILGKDESGIMRITRVQLNPATSFAGLSPSEQELMDLHHAAHERCFIARSVTSEIRIAPIGEQAHV